MNRQVRKLRIEPEVLEKYVSVVKGLDSPVIKRTMVLERSGKVYYTPYTQREANNTKLRVVYDTSAKSGKGGFR